MNKFSKYKFLKNFSLIELIIVIVILSVVLAVSTPKLALFYRGIKLNQTARQIMIYLNSIRDTAVFEKKICRISLDSKWEKFSLTKQNDPVNEPDEYIAIGGRRGLYKLKPGISISKVVKSGNTVNYGSKFELDIHPIMSKDEYIIFLQDGQKNEVKIKIEAGSGIARIVE